MPKYTIKLQDVLNFCSTQADLYPLSNVGGYTNEPGLSFCNDAISDLIAEPRDWKCNRNEMPMLVTCPQKQDYLFAGATVFSLGATAQGWAIAISGGISVTGGVVTIKTIESHRFAVGDTIFLNNVVMTTGDATKYNSVFTDNGSSTAWTNGYVITSITANALTFTAVTGQNNQDIGGAPGITNFGFLTSGSMVQMINTSSPQWSHLLYTFRELPVTSVVMTPDKVSVINDDGAGTLKIRFYYVPGATTWGAKLVYQAQAPTKTDLTQNWAPFPDSYSALYRQAVIARMYRYLNSSQQVVEYQKLEKEIARFLGLDDAEQSNVTVKPETGLMDSGAYWSWDGF